MDHVELKNIGKRFGLVEAIADLDLTVAKGEFCALLGPSGCGKSTLLRVIAGLEIATKGRVFINGTDVTMVPPAKREIAMVFQSYALYPHMTVRQNIGFSLDIARAPKAEIRDKVDRVAQALHLEELMERRPAQLSGGQRQRVAIGRALVRDPEVFLFDEPLSNLDAKLRTQMRLELANLHQELKATMIYVTHDQVEAMTLADKIVVLDAGRISQVGTPLELYNEPANRFVASFIGSPSMNFLPVKATGIAGRTATLDISGAGAISVKTHRELEAVSPRQLELGIRPEHLDICDADNPDSNLTGKVHIVERLGNSTIIYVDTDAGSIIVEDDGDAKINPGENVGIVIQASRAHVFADNAEAV
jgi:multiple sugar transport system ATP-binding protein